MKKAIILLIVLSLFLLACSKPIGPAAEIGDLVTVEYTATLADGSLFDQSKDYDKLYNFEKNELGMHKGEQKKVLLSPETAYGLSNPQKIELIPLDNFPSGSRLRVGMSLPAKDSSNGEQVQGRIMNITEEGVLVDFNHPMAGESLWMDVKVKNIVKG